MTKGVHDDILRDFAVIVDRGCERLNRPGIGGLLTGRMYRLDRFGLYRGFIGLLDCGRPEFTLAFPGQYPGAEFPGDLVDHWWGVICGGIKPGERQKALSANL